MEYNDRYRGRSQAGGDRDLFDRMADEMRSWFGDQQAERRRQMDQRRDPSTWHASGGSDSDDKYRGGGGGSFGGRTSSNNRDYDEDRGGYGRSTAGRYESYYDSDDDDWGGGGRRRNYERGSGGALGYGGATNAGYSAAYGGTGGGYSGSYDRERQYGQSEFGGGQSYRSGGSSMGGYGRYDEGGFGGESHRGKGPRNYTRSMERIQDDICEALSDDDSLDASDIEVKCEEGGEVTLTGYVRSRHDKRRAEDCAQEISGVRHVQNILRVHDNDSDENDIGYTSDVGTTRRTRTGNMTNG